MPSRRFLKKQELKERHKRIRKERSILRNEFQTLKIGFRMGYVCKSIMRSKSQK